MTIAPPRSRRDQSRLNLIDYALMGLGSSLAAYTAGMSIGREDTAQFLATGTLLGTALSYLVRTLFGNTSAVKVDGILYSAAIGCAVVGFPTLNGLLPDEGFARDVMMAGVLAWMIVLGSVMTWRDGTLLFQAIPSVALFGLVGCYDTYAWAPYLFFGFLVCLAIVLARANRREMMRQAVESGYFNRADAPSSTQAFPEQSPELYEDIRRGPWRWQAGPEWALASALVIVLLSGLGAPALQEAAKPITGAVKILAPSTMRNRGGGGNTGAQATSYLVGRGPNGSLSDRVLFLATLDRPRYLRTAAYEVYTGRGWRTDVASAFPSSGQSVVGNAAGASIRAMGKRRTSHEFSILPQDPTRQLPLPGEPLKVGSGGGVRFDGGGFALRGFRGAIAGTLVEATVAPTRVPAHIDGGDVLYQTTFVTERVREFALAASRGARNDYESARMIAQAIARQVRYNINAAAVPADEDPADWFLFSNKEGYCDLFATVMTLSARSAGLPARYVIGYLPELGNDAGSYALREADYHAWCEVFFKDVGWVVFDATSGAAQVEGGERGSSDASRPWYTGEWVVPSLRAIFGLLVVGAGIATLRSLRPKPRPARWETHRAYAAYERALRRAIGRRRHPGETIEAYALAAAEALPGGVALGGRFVRALYGPAELSDAEVAELRAATKGLRKR